jgi:hypothetical protein
MTLTSIAQPTSANFQAVKFQGLYQTDHQAKLDHLQAETEGLLSQLQNLKQQRDLPEITVDRN